MTEEVCLNKNEIHNEKLNVAVDTVIFSLRSSSKHNYRMDDAKDLCVLLERRNDDPFKDMWTIPGDFLKTNETTEEAALRQVKQVSKVLPNALFQLGVFSKPSRDPRGRILSNAFISIINESKDDSASCNEGSWFHIEFYEKDGITYLILNDGKTRLEAKLKEKHSKYGRSSYELIESANFSFDHAEIIASSIKALRNAGEDFENLFDFLPPLFTLTELQRVQELILNTSILAANFRRKVSSYVEETPESTSGVGHRPAKLFRRKLA